MGCPLVLASVLIPIVRVAQVPPSGAQDGARRMVSCAKCVRMIVTFVVEYVES